jgi:4-hydroxybenzoate polyprenyltransferase
VFTKIRHFLALVRFSHTLFALPFALASLLWASKGWPTLRVFALVMLCMVTCRNAAMAFNRLADAAIDARNPRTARRHLPAGLLGRGEVALFFAVNSLMFLAATWFLNALAFFLAVPALFAVCFYSVTKRFTSWSHLFLGAAIGISPAGAWIAARGTLDLEPVLLSVSLLLWIAGFDIIYAAQDEAFDRTSGLNSLVVRFGRKGALRISLILHTLFISLLIVMQFLFEMGWPFGIAIALAAALIGYLHLFRRSDSLDSLNQDFFLANILISLVIFVGLAASVFWTPLF